MAWIEGGVEYDTRPGLSRDWSRDCGGLCSGGALTVMLDATNPAKDPMRNDVPIDGETTGMAPCSRLPRGR